MSDQFWLSEEQLARIEPYFPLSHGVPRVDDRKVISGIIHVIRNGLRWRDAPEVYGPHKTLAARRRRTGDPPAPRVSGLSDGRGIVRIWIGQRIACRNIHQQERIEGNPQAACLDLLNSLHNGKIRRCAAKGRATGCIEADHMGSRACHAIHGPALRCGHLGGVFDPGFEQAVSGPQIGAEPADHEADALDTGSCGLQLVECCDDIRNRVGGVDVFRCRITTASP